MMAINVAGISLPTSKAPGLRASLNKGSIAIVVIMVVAMTGLRSTTMLDLPGHYFATQDIYLLTLAAAALPLLARASFRGESLAGINGKTAIAAILS